ncbi:MAG: hypothetical protein M9962_04130 [Oligoflexia bacterium]|nr:hypothetical protein [Oligoflexia bacterium]
MEVLKKSLLFVSIILYSCGSPDLEGVTPVTPQVDTQTSSCSSSSIFQGTKGNVAATARGVFADVKMIPGTTRTAIAYYDRSSYTVKFSYFDGVSYQTEIIAGDNTGNGSATHVRLDFFSDGRPIVAYSTTATTVKVAMRSAAVTSSGVWTAAVVDTFTAGQTRALSISVNPLDEVLVTYITHATTTPRLRALFCDAGCSSPSSFFGMTAAENIEGANIGSNQMDPGISWCRVNSAGTDFYPVVAYGGTAQMRYGVCRQSNLSNCLTAASWTKQNIAAMANSVMVNPILDPTVVDDVPKVIGRTATGIVPYLMNASTACSAAPTAFTAGAAIGGANAGNSWADVLKDGSGKFHIVTNISTTSVGYFNSQTTTFNGAWNTVGTMNTVTLPAATAGSGNAAIDTSSGVVYGIYGSNAAPYQMYLSKVNDITVASSAATFTNSFPDNTGNIMQAGTGLPIKNIGADTAPSGNPGVVFIDYSVGALASAVVKYGYKSNGSWTFQTIPTGANPRFPSLAFDHLNRPWIGYFDDTDDRFYLVYNAQADGSGTWNSIQMPLTPTGTYTLPAANETAMAMYYSGGVAYPVLFVIDNTNTIRGIRSGMYSLSSGTWSNLNITTPLITLGGASGGRDLSADYDTSGNIVLSYYDLTDTVLRYGYTSNGGSSFSINSSITPLSHGLGAAIKINPATSKPAVAYYDLANNKVYYSPCTSTLSGCATSGWVSATEIENAAGVSTLTTTTSNFMQAGLEFTDSGTAVVQYVTGQATTGSLKQCTVTSALVSSCTTVHAGANGNFSGSSVNNYAIAGWALNLVKTAATYFESLFLGPGGWVYKSTCNI